MSKQTKATLKDLLEQSREPKFFLATFPFMFLPDDALLTELEEQYVP